MSLPSVNFQHLTESKKKPWQYFKTHGHCNKVKGQIRITPWCCTPTTPKQSPYQVLTSYTLRFQGYCPDKILKDKVTRERSKIKSRSHHDVAHLHPLTSVPTKYHLPYTSRFLRCSTDKFLLPPACPRGHHGWQQIPWQHLRAVAKKC